MIFSSSFYHKSRRETALVAGQQWREENMAGVKFIWIRTPPYTGSGFKRLLNMLYFPWRLYCWTRFEDYDSPDVVIGSSPDLFTAWTAMFVAGNLGVPFVFEVRDLWPETFVQMGRFTSANIFVRLMSMIENCLYRNADHIVTLLPDSIDYIASKGGEPDRITWLPNGVFLPKERNHNPSPESKKVTLMYAGAHSLANNLMTLMEAVQYLEAQGYGETIRIRLVGDGPEKPMLQEFARHAGLESVTFEDPVPKKYMAEKLQEADGFIILIKNLPLYRWGYSMNKLFDYMAAARPVIIAVAARYNPVKEAGAGLTVEPENAESLAEGIKRFCSLPIEVRTAMGQKGFFYVREKHQFSVIAEKMEKILENVLLRTGHVCDQ